MDHATNTTAPVTAARTQSPGLLRTLLIVVLLATFWTFNYLWPTLEMAMFTRFVSRFAVLALFLLLFMSWWLSNRRIDWRSRWLAVVALVVCTVVAGLLSDPSVGIFGTLITHFPLAVTAWVLWYFVVQNRNLRLQRAGLVLLTAMLIFPATLVRWDGLDGAQRSQVSWRWSPTVEELFLAEQQQGGGTAEPDAAAAQEPWVVRPGDWPEFRGPNRDGRVHGVRLAAWKTDPPVQRWRQRVGPAWSGIIVVDGHIVTQEQRGDAEAITCYDAETGTEVWTVQYPARFTEHLSGIGPRSTPTFHDGQIYAYGATGILTCVRASDGVEQWSRNVIEDSNAVPPQWGNSVSPLVVDGKVVVFAGGGSAQGLVAFDCQSGDPVWSVAGGELSYSSPQLSTSLGGKQILMLDNQSLVAASSDGEKLWERPNTSKMEMPMLQPQLLSSKELLIQGEHGIALVELIQNDAVWTTRDLWSTTRLKPGFNDYFAHDGHIYGLDDGILCCLDLKDGKRLWKKGRFGHGQLLLLPDQEMLLVLAESGEMTMVEASPEGLREHGNFRAIEGKSWSHPVLAHGRLFVRNSEEMACYDVRLSE